eukprot:5533372-Karenia_brevis.AAC.1
MELIRKHATNIKERTRIPDELLRNGNCISLAYASVKDVVSAVKKTVAKRTRINTNAEREGVGSYRE